MDYQFTLRRFFVLVFLFVICPLVAWIAYAHRTNAPANMFAAGTDSFPSNNVTIPDNELDVATPFYQNDSGKLLQQKLGRTPESDAEGLYYHPKEGSEGKSEEKSNAAGEKKEKSSETEAPKTENK